MALLSQQALRIAASFSSSLSSAVFDSGSLDYTSSCWTFRSSTLPGRTTKFVSSCGRPFTKLPRISHKLFASVNCLPQWHSIGILGVYCRSSQRRRAKRGDGSGSGDETEDIEDEEIEKDEETLEELSPDVEEVERNENKGKQGADRQESQGGNGEGNREEADHKDADHKETVLQNEDFKTAFARKIWGLRRNEEDNSLGPEEELLLRDLESLNFNWRALLDPTWENLLALGFTALLAVGLLKISFQLVLVVFTILFAALKYTVVAALLLGLLIFLL